MLWLLGPDRTAWRRMELEQRKQLELVAFGLSLKEPRRKLRAVGRRSRKTAAELGSLLNDVWSP